MARRNWFWLKWPQHKQQRFFSMAKWAWLLLLVASFGPQYFLTVNAQKRIERQKDLYARVVPVAMELRMARERENADKDIDPQSLVSRIAEQSGIGWERIRFEEQQSDRFGITFALREVTLVELTSFLMKIRNSSGLHCFEFTLQRSPSNAMLADVTLTLAR
ncbi:type II secretion system protein GspM [Salidesulfovibrio onnuriiensis]|uniref:type II secretion system protein GspM n=1 Tax=Salidesulfovibrio onnuriiensis TaxID=2583823 RepID=UPI0011C96244|nr:type II secretion system protein GspM [Salidesulfovibrio onnuriiensis]